MEFLVKFDQFMKNSKKETFKMNLQIVSFVTHVRMLLIFVSLLSFDVPVSKVPIRLLL